MRLFYIWLAWSTAFRNLEVSSSPSRLMSSSTSSLLAFRLIFCLLLAVLYTAYLYLIFYQL